MSGDARERRMLHEHEIVLFSLMFAFFIVGLFVWGLDADALEYSVNGVTLIDGNSISVLAKNGVLESRDLILKNSLVEGVESSSIVILKVSANAIRTIDKKGIAAVLAEAKANGNILV